MSTDKQRPLYFWREGMFAGLNDLVKVFSVEPSYTKFVEFAQLREKGLRKPALNVLSEFIENLKKKPFAEKKSFVSLFCETSLRWGGDSYLFSPQPLLDQIIRPTAIGWTKEEPNNALSFRWAGIYCDGDREESNKYFRQAVNLDPSDDYSRSRIINTLLHEPDHSTHHLNESTYLGEPEEDLKSLELAKTEVSQLKNQESIEYWTKEINEYESMIRDWLEYSSEERKVSFPKFAKEEKGRDYGWSKAFYYNK